MLAYKCWPGKNKKMFFIFLFWNLDWNWNWSWDWSWNDLRECQKLSGGLCVLYRTYTGSEAPPITAIQNTQAPQSFWHSLKSFQLQFQFQLKFEIHLISFQFYVCESICKSLAHPASDCELYKLVCLCMLESMKSLQSPCLANCHTGSPQDGGPWCAQWCLSNFGSANKTKNYLTSVSKLE